MAEQIKIFRGGIFAIEKEINDFLYENRNLFSLKDLKFIKQTLPEIICLLVLTEHEKTNIEPKTKLHKIITYKN